MPNGALASLAGNIDPHHRVAIADLVLAQSSVRRTVERLMRDIQPDLVGLSVMTFQRGTARRIISLVRSLKPDTRIVVGGYDPSLAPDAWTDPILGVDMIVRGEGELTFRELLRAIERGTPLSDVAGLWFREQSGFRRTPVRPVTSVEEGTIRPPNRDGRVLSGYTMLGRAVDVVETSRGCTFDCSFCSIIEMRGRNFHRFPLERVIADIADARRRGARAIFIVDDNITLDVARFEALCQAIIDAGLTDIDYMVQGMTSSIAQHGDELAPLMRRGRLPLRVPRHREHPRSGSDLPEGGAKNSQREAGRTDRQCVNYRGRHPASPRHARHRRPHRRQPRRHAGVDRRQPRLRAEIRRLAVHPASDAVSGHADDARFRRARAGRQSSASRSTTGRRRS